MDTLTSEMVWTCVTDAIKTVVEEAGEELDVIKPSDSLIKDLGVPSMNIVHLMVTIEDKIDSPLNFHKLACRDGDNPNPDMTVGILHQFVCESLGVPISDKAV